LNFCATRRDRAAARRSLRTPSGRIRVEPSQHHVAIGDRQRPVAAIGGGSGIGTGGFRSDAKSCAVESEDRAAARGDGVDLHHRRPHAHPGDLRLVSALELAVVMRDVGRGAAHVEADDALEAAWRASLPRRRCRRRTGEDAVLALEALRIGQAPFDCMNMRRVVWLPIWLAT